MYRPPVFLTGNERAARRTNDLTHSLTNEAAIEMVIDETAEIMNEAGDSRARHQDVDLWWRSVVDHMKPRACGPWTPLFVSDGACGGLFLL